jgi:cytochrome c oxidase accessory protein FixG
MSHNKDNEVSFRDRISTVDDSGKRKWIYPKKPHGKWYTKRTILSYILLALLFILPFLKYNEEPLFLLNVLERKFIIFGMVFTPQDLHLFAIGMISLMLFIVLFTFVFGRLFCGWVCPQTIFMELVYRRIEYAIEGDAAAQKRLNSMPWTANKIMKKALKHVIFLVLAFVFISMAMSFVVGIDKIKEVWSDPFANTSIFLTITAISFVFYFVFAFFREQVCTNVCPYGRMQSVLLVDDTIVVHYDFVRGEKRASLKERNKLIKAGEAKEEDFGDCIDCGQCVAVCPTGIDIRNGTQLECVNCTACMDACDDIMVKINKPTGLIRYASEKSIKEGVPFKLPKRAKAYVGVLIVIVGLFAYMASNRVAVEGIILRTPGMTYQYVEGDSSHILNVYNFKLINKTASDLKNVEIKVKNIKNAKLQVIPEKIDVIPEFGRATGSMVLTIPVSEMKGYKTPIQFEIYSEGKLVHSPKTNFLGPH